MKHRLFSILAIVGICCHLTFAEDRWVWSNRNRRDRSYRVNRDDDDRDISNDKYRSEQLYEHIERQRDREPTTKRPIPGLAQNEDIDDYVDSDSDDKNVVGNRNYPYAPNGFFGGQLGGGGGFNQFSGTNGFGGNGILVGPGGPTGVIGRPQNYFPGGYPGALGQPGLGGTAVGGGNPSYPIQPGSGIYPNNGFGQAQGGHYPGSFYSPNGQYPNGQYPVQPNQFGGGVGGGIGGAQYPGIGQYSGNGPIYTEGYGLANLNGGYPSTGIGLPQNHYGGLNGFGAAYNFYDQTNKKLQAEGKNASEDSRNISDRVIDDKVNKNLKKTA